MRGTRNPQNGVLDPLTETGQFHISLLRLNRPQLIDYRVRRQLAVLLAEEYQLLREENAIMKQRLTNLEEYLHQLQLRKKEEPDHL